MVIGEDDTAPGFIFGPRHSRRHPAKVLSDTDFADDIVLLSNTINQARGYCTELNQHVIQLLSIATHPKTKYVASALTAPSLTAPSLKPYLIRDNQMEVSQI